MRIIVVSAFEAGSHKAHALNTIKMAQGFARLGHRVTIICRQSWRGPLAPTRLAAQYGLTEPLRWIQIPHYLPLKVDGEWYFGPLAAALAHRLQPDFVFTRNYIAPWLMSRHGIPTAAESHAATDERSLPFLYFAHAVIQQPALRRWVTISPHLARHYQTLGVPAEKVLVLPDAVDMKLFQRPAPLPTTPYAGNGPHVVYTGHLYDYKGIPTILDAATHLPGVQFHLVGGLPEDRKRQEARARQMGLRNVVWYGQQPLPAVPPYLWHADIALLPPSQYHPSAAWTSPMKLGEYMAAQVPIIATDIPALRHWLTPEQVEFVTPDDGSALAAGIERLLHDAPRRAQLRQTAWQCVQGWSFEQRAQTILDQAGV